MEVVYLESFLATLPTTLPIARAAFTAIDFLLLVVLVDSDFFCSSFFLDFYFGSKPNACGLPL